MSVLIKREPEPDIHVFEDNRFIPFLFAGVAVAYSTYFPFLLIMKLFISYLYTKYKK